MSAFRCHTGICAPLRLDNVDTDQIIPSREMKTVSKEGLGRGLFAGWRYEYDGARIRGPKEDFVLNEAAYRGASILLCGRNFGCGSSREHAVWALRDFGIRVLIAESFGKIFRANCARNRLLALELPAADIDSIQSATSADPQSQRLTVDLVASRLILPDDQVIEFSLDDFDRGMLLKGLDYIDFALQYEEDIDTFERRDRQARPWAWLGPGTARREG